MGRNWQTQAPSLKSVISLGTEKVQISGVIILPGIQTKNKTTKTRQKPRGT